MKKTLMILLCLFALTGSACPPSGQKSTVSPTAKTDAPVDVPVTANDIGTLEQNILQKLTTIQTTISNQTTNYQRDREQAKTDRRVFAAIIAMICAGAVVGWCSPACLKGLPRIIALAGAGALVTMAVFGLMW